MQARVEAHREQGSRFVDLDPLYQAAKSGDDLEPLYVAREELAREAAALLFARIQSVPGSRETGRLASRRIAALREIASLTLALDRMAVPAPDRLARIIANLREIVGEAAEEVLPTEHAEMFKKAWRLRLEPELTKLLVHV